MRHILYIVDTFYGNFGGAEGALTRLVRNLPTDRYRASIVTFKAGPQVDVNGAFDCPFHHFPLTRTYDWTAMRTAWKIRKMIREERVDLVHTFHETADLFGGLIAKASGPKLISSRRDMGFLREKKHSLVYRWMARHFDQVHTVSEEVRSFMIETDGLQPGKVLTVHNGIDMDLIENAQVPSDLRSSLGIEHAAHLVVTVGNLRKIKGIETLVRCAARVAQQMPGAVFLVVGNIHEPDYLHEMEQLRDSLGITRNVIFPGRRYDIFSILKAADVYCLPSLTEGLSNALLEAMGAGLPAVATRVGGNPELVAEGQTGFLVESGDDAAMAERILTLLRDPAQAHRMGERARSLVRAQFTTQAMTNRVLASYDALLA